MATRICFMAPRPATPRCDFCHAADAPLTPYACQPFTLLFIRRGDALVIQIASGIVTRYPATRGVERQIIATLRGFWRHRACPN